MKTKTKTTYGLNLETDLIKKGGAQAKARRQSFSAYVNQLISDDLTCEVSANKSHDDVAMSRRPRRAKPVKKGEKAA